MKILGIISTFYPKIDELERNINSFLPWIDFLIIWENTPRVKSYVSELIDRLNSPKVEVRTTGHNEYLATPFNLCARFAEENDFTHLLTMDQDSSFSDGHFKEYIDFISNYSDGDAAAFGPNSKSRSAVDNKNPEVDHVFISGAIYPIDSFRALNGFDEKLVIDGIDIDYCLRAKEKNKRIIVVPTVNLNHQLGYRYKHWSGLEIVPYSPQRTYYFIRNTLFLWKKYPSYFKKSYKKSFVKYRIVFRTLKLIFEKDSCLKFKAIFMALMHYNASKLGRYDNFTK